MSRGPVDVDEAGERHDGAREERLPVGARQSGWQIVACFLLLLIALHLVIGPYVKLTEWHVDPARNTNFMEALAWRAGRLDLSQRVHDSALYDERIYSVNPPLFTFLSYGAITLAGWLHQPTEQFFAAWYVMLVALPLPLVGYWAFYRARGSAAWAAFLTFSWIAGTAVFPCLIGARDGGICPVDHLLSQIGLMLIAGTLVANRPSSLKRTWPAWLGLLIAAWSRPPTLAYALPVALAAGAGGPVRTRLIGTGITAGVAISVLMALNTLKFDSVLESGYRYVYEGRSDQMAQRGRAALFSPVYVADNLRWMNWELPGFELGSYGIRPVAGSYGTSVWFTTPILLLALWSVRTWWRDAARRWLMLASLLPTAAFLFYHNSGYIQVGYFRYALDFIPIWLVVLAPEVRSPARMWFAIVATAWSALYFNMMAPLNT